jgi:hypothetical protein
VKRGYQRPWAEILDNARDPDLDSLRLDVEPDDRFGAPLPNRFKSRLRRLPGCLLATGMIWMAMSNPERAQAWFASAKFGVDAVVSSAREIAERVDRERGAAHAGLPTASAEPAPPIAPIEQATISVHDEAGDGLSTGTMGTAYAETPEPAVAAQDKSPKRAHAIAAGLSPDLPNVLLTRLSESDLKNAGYAVKTALAKTPDDALFAWPPKPSQQQALFEVRFVAGASQGCRRYIVTVTKERWSSTTAAMEKCGDAVLNAG